MTDLTKRPRSPSPVTDNDIQNNKRPKDQTQKQGNGVPAKPATETIKTTADMADTEHKADDIDAVDLGSGSVAEDVKNDSGTAIAGQGGPSDGNEAPDVDEQVGDGLQGAEGDAPPANISMRALIVTGDASIIIGKGGKHINEIREKSGAKLTISESLPGNPERILTVAGPLDAVSKAFGLIVRRINDEPFEQPSVPGSRSVTIRFIVPNARMGSVIGRQGTKIKEIQEASGARLTAGEQMLPGSTERVLNISGVADAVHIAVYYVGNILLEHQDRTANNVAYRPTAGISRAPPPPYTGASQYGIAGAGLPGGAVPMPPFVGQQIPAGSQTQQIFVPNDLVGCIIGKGGQKINEVRQMSGSHIKIMEPGAGIAAGGSGTERLVTITGPPANIQMAVQLLYQRLEQEKLRLSTNGGR